MNPSPSSIRHLGRTQLDVEKWDACVHDAANGLVYAYSFYLDALCTQWDGLVLGDYEAVMPLPWRKKGGVRYLYQPFAVAQLGVFGKAVSAETLQAFLVAIPLTFRYWDFPLNHGNVFPVTSFPLYTRQNFVLPLQAAYETLSKNYRENVRRNIKKCSGYGCTVRRDVAVEDVLALTRYQPQPVNAADAKAFAALYHRLQQNGQATTYGVLSNKGELLASCVFFFSHQRAYYILVGNHPNGRTLGASHSLIDAFIRDGAEQDLWLDFEGSDVRNLAFFYSSFGAVEEPYAAIRFNRLPWWLRWTKPAN